MPPFLDEKIDLGEIAEAEQRVGFLLAFGRDFAGAEIFYTRAASSYDLAGRQEMAVHCRQKIRGLALRAAGDVNEAVRQVQDSLDHAEVDRCGLLADLGELLLSAGDAFEAERRLLAAEEALRKIAPESPSAEEILDAACASADLSGRSSLTFKIHDLDRRLCSNLAFLFRTRRPETAQRYAARLEEILAAEPSPEALEKRWQEARFAEMPDDPLPGLDQKPMFAELRQVLGEEAVRQQFGDLEEQMAAGERSYRQRAAELRQATATLGLAGMIDPAHIASGLDQVAVEDAALPAGAPRDILLRRVDELEAQARQIGSPDLVATALVRRVTALWSAGREEEALVAIEAGLEEAERTSPMGAAVALLGFAARIQAGRNAWQAVDAACARGIEHVETHRARVSSPYLQSAYLAPRIELYSLGVRAALELGRTEEALDRADRSKCRAILGYSRQTERPAGESATAFRRACQDVNTAAAAGAVPAELRLRRQMAWERLFLERARRGAGEIPEGVALEAVQETLAADEAILYYYWVGERELLIAVLGRETVRSEVRSLSAAERETVERFSHPPVADRRGAQDDEPFSLPEVLPIDDWLALLAPILLPTADAFAGKRKLLVSPHRQLHMVPFHALPWDGGVLIRRFSLLLVPNLGSLLLRRARSEATTVVAIGVEQGKAADVKIRLQFLKEAEAEARDIARIYHERGLPVVLLTGETARESYLQGLVRAGALTSVGCLHIASHGSNVEEDSPMESCLFLNDGPLEGIEIADWRLNADLVVLSACYSGKRPVAGRGLRELPGDEMFGLQAAFFAAGVRSVLGALWPAGDRVAREVMTAFHRHRAGGAAPEDALRLAVLGFLDEGQGRSKTFAWAPFFVVALGRG